MPSISAGFDVGIQVLPWGTTLLNALLCLTAPDKADTRSVKFQSAQVFGLTGTFAVNLRAPAPDRPVMQAWYEWANASDADLIAGFTRVFGPPAEQTDYDLSQHRNPIWAVRRALRWRQVAGFDVGISIYGAPRQISEGLSAGVFYVHWDDELAAAAPYLAAMTEFEHWLEGCAARAEHVWQGTLEENQGRYPKVVSPPIVDPVLLRAGRCLRRRLLYQTPTTLQDSIQPNQVLVWKDVPDAIWCISNHFETVCFQAGQPVNAVHTKLLPAKGGGATFLTISDLTLESTAISPVLAELANFLRDEMGVKVSFMEDYDI